MNEIHLGQEYLKELEMEVTASKKCLERVPPELFEYKPHEKSMSMGYLASIVAEIPRWVSIALTEGVINFATFQHPKIATTEDLVKYFDDNMELARQTLSQAKNEDFDDTFELRSGDQLLMSDSKKNTVTSSINHLVHHRGQLTVYMRLNNIAVPSIYGPSADDKTF
jgi:uncharacterized damage-inducible protein DinB